MSEPDLGSANTRNTTLKLPCEPSERPRRQAGPKARPCRRCRPDVATERTPKATTRREGSSSSCTMGQMHHFYERKVHLDRQILRLWALQSFIVSKPSAALLETEQAEAED